MHTLPGSPVGPQLRAATYVRVSSKEQVEGYSLDAQRRACRDFATTRGFQVVADYSDEGVSAFTDNVAKRPGFSRLLNDVAAGLFDVVLVHKLDRWARKQRIGQECLEYLGKHQVRWASVSEPDLDYSTPQGFMFLSMMGMLAEYYSRNLSVETKKGWAERKQQGLYAGRLPFGAVKGEDGVPVADTRPLELDGPTTTNHEGLLLAFQRAAEGATDSEVAEALNAAGYRPVATARRARFTREGVRTILHNRFYVGELPMGKRGRDGWQPGAHQPIVPVELFDQVQRQRARRATQKNPHQVRKDARVFALSGLVRCDACRDPDDDKKPGESMHLEGRGQLTSWGRRQAEGCKARSVREYVIADELGACLRGLQFPADASERILAAYRQSKPEVGERERQRQTVEGQLRRLMDLYMLGDLEKTEYEARRAPLRAELARLQDGDSHGRPEALERLQEYLRDAGRAWEDADPAQRNKLARALFTSLYVRNQHLTLVQPRPEFQPYFVLALETQTPPHFSGETVSNGRAPESTLWRARGDSNPRSRP